MAQNPLDIRKKWIKCTTINLEINVWYFVVFAWLLWKPICLYIPSQTRSPTRLFDLWWHRKNSLQSRDQWNFVISQESISALHTSLRSIWVTRNQSAPASNVDRFNHLSLQKQLFFILLCLAVTSLIFLHQNPDWGLESIRILRLRYELSSADYGELKTQGEGWEGWRYAKGMMGSEGKRKILNDYRNVSPWNMFLFFIVSKPCSSLVRGFDQLMQTSKINI